MEGGEGEEGKEGSDHPRLNYLLTTLPVCPLTRSQKINTLQKRRAKRNNSEL